jgi:sensor domain CHASE-containing protein
VQRALNEIADTLARGAFAADYARWDDTYALWRIQIPDYIETN